MPRDANGNYTLPAGNPVTSGAIIESAWANNTMPDLGTEVQDSLSRSGKGSMLSPLKIVDFSGATPGLAFGVEPTTGFRRVGAGDARFTVLGADVLQLQQSSLIASVNVGIGVTPKSDWRADRTVLQIGGNAVIYQTTAQQASNILHIGTNFRQTESDSLYISTSQAADYYQTVGTHEFRVAASGAADSPITWTTALHINNGGNVGIGTATPKGTLHVHTASSGVATSYADANNIVIEDGNNAGLSILTPNTGSGYVIFGDPEDSYVGGLTYNHNDNELTLVTNNATRFRLDGSGNLGIGVRPKTNSFAGDSVLQLGGIGLMRAVTNAVAGSNMVVACNAYYDGTNQKRIAALEASEYLQTDGIHVFRVAPSGTADSNITWTNSLLINSEGNVGIGTATPGYALHVFSASGSDEPARFVSTNDNNYFARFQLDYNQGHAALTLDANNGQEAYVISYKDDHPNYPYHLALKSVDINGVISFFTASSSNERMRIDNSGGIFAYNLKSGTSQAGAGAAANELWVDTSAGNVVKRGV